MARFSLAFDQRQRHGAAKETDAIPTLTQAFTGLI